MKKYIAIDIETTGLDPKTERIVTVSYASHKGSGCLDPKDPKLIKVLKDPDIEKIFHNATFDLSFFKQHGYEVNGKCHDTMLLAHLINPDRRDYGLKALSENLLSRQHTQQAHKLWKWLDDHNLTKSEMSQAPKDLLEDYAEEDARNTFELFKLFGQKLKRIQKTLHKWGFKYTPVEYYNEEIIPLIPIVVDMQLRGVKIDISKTVELEATMKAQIMECLSELDKVPEIKQVEELLYSEKVTLRKKRNKSGTIKKMPAPTKFNWSSNNHLKVLFFDIHKEEVTKTTAKGNASIDADVLESWSSKYPFVQTLLKYKELVKLTTAYLKNLVEMQHGGLIHAQFNLHGTATGRLSSSKPNLQNIPKRVDIKQLFVPKSGNVFIYCDYSQLELRLAAHLSQDPLLIKAYKEGLDLHQMTADAIGRSRDLAKTINFAIIYNASHYRIADIIGYMDGLSMDDMEARRHAANRARADIMVPLFEKYKGLKKYIDTQMNWLYQKQIAVTEYGFIRRFPKITSSVKREVSHALKAGFNTPIQGLGASITKRAMIKLAKAGYSIINQIHDAIIVEVPIKDAQGLQDDMSYIKDVMETVVDLRVPLLVEPKLLKSFDEKDIYEV